MIKTKKQMYLVIGAFALVMLLTTVTYAFFNYTRTGEANTIRVGRIAFNTSQASGQDGAINLSNAFPITRTMAATDTTNAGEVVITITGDTSYSGGVEYIVTATDVTNTVNSKTVPISIIATASNGLGSSDDSYFTNRGGNSSIYKVLANETISNNDQLLVGYIAPDNNQIGVNGTITIRAYLDSDLVVISDTYNNGNTPTDNLGTPISFGENKTVLTTSEWNSLRTNGISFKVKVEAREGTWIPRPVGTATFDTGSVVNTKIRLLFANQEYNDQTSISSNDFSRFFGGLNDSIVKDNQKPNISNFTETNVLSSANSEEIIYAWKENDVIHWYTDSNAIYFNQDSSYIFAGFEGMNFENSGLELINASNVTNLSNAFRYCVKLNLTKISNWNVSNVTNMSNAFKGWFSRYDNTTNDASPLNNWNIINVTNFDNMFWFDSENQTPENCIFPTFVLRPGTWDLTPSIDPNEDWVTLYAGTYVPSE